MINNTYKNLILNNSYTFTIISNKYSVFNKYYYPESLLALTRIASTGTLPEDKIKADWKPDEKFPTSEAVWNKLLRAVMPTDHEDILRLNGLMRFLDNTHDAEKHDGLTNLHLPFVLLVTRHKNDNTHDPDTHKQTYK